MPDVNPEGLDAKSITEQTRKNLKENYGMTDEEIDKTINISLGMIDARNQFNEIYTHYRNELEGAGYRPIAADSGARMIAAKALSIIRDEKITAKDVIERLNLKFKRMKFADFKKMEAGQLGNPQYSSELDDFIPFQGVYDPSKVRVEEGVVDLTDRYLEFKEPNHEQIVEKLNKDLNSGHIIHDASAPTAIRNKSLSVNDIVSPNQTNVNKVPFQTGIVQQDDKLINRTNKNKYLTDDELQRMNTTKSH